MGGTYEDEDNEALGAKNHVGLQNQPCAQVLAMHPLRKGAGGSVLSFGASSAGGGEGSVSSVRGGRKHQSFMREGPLTNPAKMYDVRHPLDGSAEVSCNAGIESIVKVM